MNIYKPLVGVAVLWAVQVYGDHGCSHLEGNFITQNRTWMKIDPQGRIRSNLAIAYSVNVPVYFPEPVTYDPFQESCTADGYISHLGCRFRVSIELKELDERIYARVLSPTSVTNVNNFCIGVGQSVMKLTFVPYSLVRK